MNRIYDKASNGKEPKTNLTRNLLKGKKFGTAEVKFREVLLPICTRKHL